VGESAEEGQALTEVSSNTAAQGQNRRNGAIRCAELSARPKHPRRLTIGTLGLYAECQRWTRKASHVYPRGCLGLIPASACRKACTNSHHEPRLRPFFDRPPGGAESCISRSCTSKTTLQTSTVRVNDSLKRVNGWVR
jgi:hypothetical protein